MRRLLALAVLLVRPAFAELPRVVLDAPLAPVSAPAAAVGLGAAPLAAGLAPSPSLAAPSAVSAPAFAAAAPAFAAPSVAPAAAPAATASKAAAADVRLPAPAAAAASGGVAAAPASAAPAASSLESAAGEIGRRFDGAAVRPESDLLGRLLRRVSIDDGGVPANGAILHRALERMLQSPAARALAERYAAEGPTAVLRFEAIPETQMNVEGGRTYFRGTRAFTDWANDSATVRLNDAYARSDPHYLEQGLPAIIAHELLGHGFWYARAARAGVLLIFHHHELNEMNARLVGWLVDFELDQRFEEELAWTYLEDPQAYLDSLKMRLPYYAKTFSNAEMLQPVATLEKRLEAARAARRRIETERLNQKTWVAVVDHFISSHGVPPRRFQKLKAEFAQADAAYADELQTLDALSAEVDALLQTFKAETDGASEKVLRQVPSHPLFVELQRVTDESLGTLIDRVRENPPGSGAVSPDAARAREDYWRGQIDFAELQRMYFEDRRTHPQHWR